jgi:hypothetical protein
MNEFDIVTPFAQGYQAGASIAGMRERQQLFQAQRQQQEQAMARQQSMQQDFEAVYNLPDNMEKARRLPMLAIKYPEIGDKLNATAKTVGDDYKKILIQKALPAFQAIAVGQKDVGINELNTLSEAFKNSGDTASAETFKNYAESVKRSNNPTHDIMTGGMYLQSMLGVDEFNKYMNDTAKQSVDIASMPQAYATNVANAQKAQSEATKSAEEAIRAPFETQLKAIEAKYADQNALAGLQEKGWRIENLKNDIEYKKQANRIALMNASLAKQNNDLKRAELQTKIDEAQAKQNDVLRNKAADVEKARFSMDNLMTVTNDILNTPKNVIKSATGPVSTRLPTLSGDTADFEELVTTLQSQVFLSQVPMMKGMGQLTEREGAKLESSLRSLSLRQSDTKLLNNIKEIQRLTLKARKNIADQYGVPDAPVDTGNQGVAVSSGSQIQPIPKGVTIKRVK